jgi:DNA-binding NarL/FixJ family response regulator
MRVLIVNAYPLIQEAIRGAVVRAVPHAAVVAATDLGAARSLLERDPAFDAAVVDIERAGASALPGLASFRVRFPGVKVVLAGASIEPLVLFSASQIGISTYLSTTDPIEEIVAALRSGLGQAVITNTVAAEPRASNIAVFPTAQTVGPRLAYSAPDPREEAHLTERQREVLQLIARGMPNKVISRQLNLSPSTVKAHISAILRALGARNRTEAAMHAHTMAAA